MIRRPAPLPGISLRRQSNHLLPFEPFRRLVEPPGCDLLRLTVYNAQDHVGVPGSGVGAVELRWHGGMVGMAVVDADEVHPFRPCVVIYVQHLERIDDVTAGSIFRRDVLSTAGFDDAFRFTDVAQQEAATFLGERFDCMALDHSNRVPPALNHGSCQYRSPKYGPPPSANMRPTHP